MDNDTSSRFMSSLVKSIQALCNGYVEFSSSIEVIGHIHLNIDRNVKLDYVLTEEVSKSVSEDATVFASHSYHSQPPPSISAKSASDTSSRGRQKSQTRSDESDTLGLSSLPHEVPNASKSDSHSRSSNRLGESNNSFHSGTVGFKSDSDSIKQENSRSSCQMQDAADKRRRNTPSAQRTPSPAAKRVRSMDSTSNSVSAGQDSEFDVIEIKEEPDDEPAVYFGDNSQIAGGQDIQTPDFSNVVMESLDRVGQIEGTQLVGGGGGGDGMSMQQQQPFPVMLHSNAGMSSGGPLAGPSSDPQSAASTSGAVYGAWAFSGTRHTGGRPKYPQKRGQFVNNSSVPMALGSQCTQWVQGLFGKQARLGDGVEESEEMKRLRIQRERVKLRVRAHRARKRARLEAEREMAAGGNMV